MAGVDDTVTFIIRYYGKHDKIEDSETIIFPSVGPCYSNIIDTHTTAINPLADGVDKIVIFVKRLAKGFEFDQATCKKVPIMRTKLFARTLGDAILSSPTMTMEILYELLLEAVNKKQFIIENDVQYYPGVKGINIKFPRIDIEKIWIGPFVSDKD